MTLPPLRDDSHHTNETDGGIEYYKNGLNWQVLPIGSTDQVLTVASGLPSWATPTAPAMVLLATATASNDATLDFTAFDATTYASYLFVLENLVPATDLVDLYMRTSTDGGTGYDSGASDYAWTNLGVSATAATQEIDTADSEIELTSGGTGGTVGSAANEYGLSGDLTLINPGDTVYTHVVWDIMFQDGSVASGSPRGVRGSAQRESAADVDAVRFFYSSGNIESGSIRMYGMVAS